MAAFDYHAISDETSLELTG